MLDYLSNERAESPSRARFTEQAGSPNQAGFPEQAGFPGQAVRLTGKLTMSKASKQAIRKRM